MKGRLYINGTDLFTEYGLYVAEQGYNELIQWAALKDVETVDWHEYDGVEPNLLHPVLDSREFTLPLWGTVGNIERFVRLFRDSTYHSINAADIERNYSVRFVKAKPSKGHRQLCSVELVFSDDTPLGNYTYSAPTSSLKTDSRFLIDGTPFSDYGTTLLQGTSLSFSRIADVKPNLTRDIESMSGVNYEVGVQRRAPYEATLHCFMRATTLSELWNNYDALLYDMSKPDAREISIAGSGAYLCHYVKQNVRRFYHEGRIWLEFDVDMNVFRGGAL